MDAYDLYNKPYLDRHEGIVKLAREARDLAERARYAEADAKAAELREAIKAHKHMAIHVEKREGMG